MSSNYVANNFDVIPQRGFVSSNNSTTALLEADAVFTGTADDVTQFSSISVFIYTDQASATDGLSMEFSTDGTNWDRAKTIDVTASDSQVHVLLPVAQYFRVVYTNGSGGAQSAFRLQVIYHVERDRELTSGTEQVLKKHDDVTLVRLVNDVVNDRNNGRIDYESNIRIFGSNRDIGTSFEDVWTAGGTYSWPTAAEKLRIRTGGNVNDATSGSGAQTILVQGLDANFAEIEETLTCAGATISAETTQSFVRINAASVENVGTYSGANTGNIIIESASTTSALAQIDAGTGRPQQTMYTVPAGKTAYLVRLDLATENSNTAEVRFYARGNADDVTTPFTSKRSIFNRLDYTGETSLALQTHEIFQEKTDLWFSAKKVTGGGNTEVSAGYDLILVDN